MRPETVGGDRGDGGVGLSGGAGSERVGRNSVKERRVLDAAANQ